MLASLQRTRDTISTVGELIGRQRRPLQSTRHEKPHERTNRTARPRCAVCRGLVDTHRTHMDCGAVRGHPEPGVHGLRTDLVLCMLIC